MVEDPLRRAEVAGLEAGHLLDRRARGADVLDVRERGVRLRVVADLVARDDHLAQHPAATDDVVADDEEGGVDAGVAEDVQHLRRVFAGPVVERERDLLADASRGVPDDRVGADGAADALHRVGRRGR